MYFLLRMAILCLIGIGSFQSFAQYKFSLGIKAGIGAPLLQEAKLNSANSTQELTPNAGYSVGILGQYMIGEVIGVETGIQRISSSYNLRSSGSKSFKEFLGNKSIIDVYEYQIPVVLFLRKGHGSNPYIFFKLLAGTSFDWLTTQSITKLGSIQSLRTLLTGIRIEIDKDRTARIECGVDYQYSFDRYQLQAVNYNLPNTVLDTRLHMLSLHLSLFFLHKRLD